MVPELIATEYKPRRALLHLKVRVDHEVYGPVLCLFNYRWKQGKEMTLSRAFVEKKVIPFEEHKKLLEELKSNEELDNEINRMAKAELEMNRQVNKEKMIEAVSKTSGMTLEYATILASESIYSKKVKRSGPNQGNLRESEQEKHRLYIIVKFQESKDEYEFVLNYHGKKGYKIEQTYSERNDGKIRIGDYLGTRLTTQIIDYIKKKAEYLP